MTEPGTSTDLAALRSASPDAAAAAPARRPSRRRRPWWRDAVIYQVYVRSFADGNGDGTGDLAGVRSRLPYLRDLGVDAIWFTPWYVSPLADGGYDVADYRRDRPGVRHPGRGRGADRRGRRARHPDDHRHRPQPRLRPARLVPGRPRGRARLARSAPASGSARAGAPTATRCRPPGRRTSRARPGRGPPTPTARPASGTCTCSPPQQPDLNWDHPDVRREHEDDPPLLVRPRRRPASASTRPRCWSRTRRCPRSRRPAAGRAPARGPRRAPRHLPRAGARSPTRIPATRVLVGELWLPDIDRFARYLRPDELHTAFNFDFLARPWEADELRASIDATLAAHAPVGAPATWVLSNHDVTRRSPATAARTRSFAFSAKRHGTPTDLALGRAGRGPPPSSPPPCPARSTSTRATSSGSTRWRTCRPSGSRTRCTSAPAAPIPGATAAACRCPGRATSRRSASAPRTRPAEPWLPPARRLGRPDRRGRSRPTRIRCSTSTATALAIRRAEPGLGDGPFDLAAVAPDDVLAFRRGDGFVSDHQSRRRPGRALPPRASVLLASADLVDGRLPPTRPRGSAIAGPAAEPVPGRRTIDAMREQ